MTAEQLSTERLSASRLEELLAVYGSSTEARADAEFQLKQLGPSLVRRVLAAEKLVGAARVLADIVDATGAKPYEVADFDEALTAYREINP